jgi:predicted DNA-binding transcriptional regulator YafY
MPGDSTRNTLLRQWEMLKLIPARRPGCTALDITQSLNELGYPVSKRTIERDLEQLSAIFPLACDDRSIPYGWHWIKGTTIDLPGITLAEALSLQLIESSLTSLLPAAVVAAIEPRLHQATQRLEAEKGRSNIARWLNKVRSVPPALPLQPPQLDHEILETIQSALLYEVQLAIDYTAMDADTSTTRLVNPLALIQRGPVTYLVAIVHGYSDVRLFALHRVSRAEQQADKAIIPDDFDIDHYLQAGAAQFGSGGFVDLVIRVKPWLVRILTETPLAEPQKITVDGDHSQVTARVADSWQLRWWILGKGAAVEVICCRANVL